MYISLAITIDSRPFIKALVISPIIPPPITIRPIGSPSIMNPIISNMPPIIIPAQDKKEIQNFALATALDDS